jgi:serine/threonine protein kinase
MTRCPNPRCQTDYPAGTVQCTNPFCQCLLPEAVVAGRYRIETLIGMGGMGAVYRASDTFEVQQVALKILSFAKAKDMDTAVERFRREARYAHQLRHKNIVPVLNFGQDDKLLYLAMPLVTGGTLKELLKAESPLPIPQAQRYLNELADAIDAIHNHPQQIVHRDIKPSNLLIHQNDGRLVITDFGIARAMQQEKALTQRGWRLGTEHYMAPEQEHGKAKPASDIYSMGVIGYQMLTGLLPFQAVIRNHAAGLPAPSALNHALPAAVDPVILQAINVDPAKRFRTAREFADALNTALALTQAPEPDTGNDIWTVPTISVRAGAGPAQGPVPAPASPLNANVIVHTIIPDNPCGNCGRANRSTSHFCRHCGHSLGETSPLVTDVCQVGYLSNIGQQAHDNQDTLLIVQGLCNTLQPPPRPFSLLAVADGQGQAPLLEGPLEQATGAQDVAGLAPVSRLAIETITDVLLPLLCTPTTTQSLPSTPIGGGLPSTSTSISRLQPTKQTDEERIEQWMRNAVRQANQVIYHCNADYDATMASTLASLILYKRRLYLANVGDSRAYCYNQKMGLQQIGHSSNNQHIAQTPVGTGIEANLTPTTPVKAQISNSLADDDTIKHSLGQQYQIAIELFKRDVEVDDLILLCTNSLWRMLDNEHLQKILALGGDTQRLAHTLVEAANTAGGTGNISAIVVRIQ